MPKRKREQGDNGQGKGGVANTGHSQNYLRKRADEKISHGRKVLQRALKLAKGFERQKLSRRQKTAAEKEDIAEISRIAHEIAVLKDLDLASCADHHLNKSLLKIKRVASSSALPASVTVVGKQASEDNAIANVTARLYNANPVKAAMKATLANVQLALGLEASSGANDLVQTEPPFKKQRSESSEPGKKMLIEKEDLDDDNDDGSGPAAHVAGASDVDSVSGSEDDVTPRSMNLVGDYSLSPSVSRSVTPETQTKAPRKPPSTSNTSFLPSLTMGGYWSGSENGSDVEQDVEEIAPRRNRRGQRARQQIWEKKFGKSAKHLQKSTSEASQRDKGWDKEWDMKRGAQGSGSKTRGSFRPRWQQSREAPSGPDGAPVSGGNATQLAPRVSKPQNKPERPMHPSWEAAKKSKEQSQTQVFAGKKLVF